MNKFCNSCETEKPITEFYKNSSAKDGLQHHCKDCKKAYNSKNREKINARCREYNKTEKRKEYVKKYNKKNRFCGTYPEQKRCCTCKEVKTIEYFTKNASVKDGLEHRCKECKRKYVESVKESKKIIPENKKCPKCNEFLLNDEFYKTDRSKDGLYTYCKKCSRALKQESWEKDKERRKERYHTDIEYKLLNNLRSRVNQAVKGYYKSRRTIELIGCSVEFLVAYLEEKFDHKMNWENYGYYGWHIDHIEPCSSFDLTDEQQQKECFHYTNLQPLWAEENFKKSDSLNWSKDDARGIRFRDS